MDTTRKSFKRHRSEHDNTTYNPVESWPRYLIIEPTDENGFDKLSPFAVEKGIQGLAGAPKSVTKLRSGALLVEVTSKAHSDNLLRAKALVSVPIKVSAHRTLNFKKGVIRCEGLDRATKEELDELKEQQNITELRRISITREQKKILTHTYIVTFQLTSLPQKIRIGYIETRVKPFIPNPLRCFKCQRFGHHQSKCRKQEVCARCLGTDHDKSNCTMEPKCQNCEGRHESNSRDCPAWKKEKKINELKTTNNISFYEARKLVSATTPAGMPAKTFASAVAASLPSRAATVTSVGTQTDITWPGNKENHSIIKPVTQSTQTTKVQSPTLERSKSLGPTVTNRSQDPRAPRGSPHSPEKGSGKKQAHKNQNKTRKGDKLAEFASNRFEALSDISSPEEEMELTVEESASPKSPSRGRNRSRGGKPKT